MLQTPKYKYLRKSFGDKPFTLLDIGCGVDNARKIQYLFPNCQYVGLDNFGQNRPNHIACDLNNINVRPSVFIKNNFFDAIWFAHVLEHLNAPYMTMFSLVDKLKPEGFIYVETPSEESLYLPYAKKGTLNFFDDPTHTRPVRIDRINRIARNCYGFRILSTGTRRSWFHILAMPFRLLIEGYNGNIFWDWYGFANYTYLRKIA